MIRAAFLPKGAVALIDLLQRIVDAPCDQAAQGYAYDPDDDLDGAWTISVESTNRVTIHLPISGDLLFVVRESITLPEIL